MATTSREADATATLRDLTNRNILTTPSCFFRTEIVHVGHVDGEEVTRDDCLVLGLGAQERCPCRAAAAGRWVDAVLLEVSQTVEGATVMPRAASSPVIRRYPRFSLSRAMRSTRRVMMG